MRTQHKPFQHYFTKATESSQAHLC